MIVAFFRSSNSKLIMKYGLKTLLLVVSVVAIILASSLYWDAIPGTFYKDSRGFPHGTGQAEYFYDAGPLMLREHYYRGLVYEITWYKPDGSEIATETFHKETGGTGYYLRQDGTVKSKHVYHYSHEDRGYFGDGSPTIYDQLGNPVGVAPGAPDDAG